ncbi:unnamed protein product, partial [marine sediment metagenome]
TGDMFFRSVTMDSLGEGISHILIDYQPVGEEEREVQTKTDQQQANLRPIWVHLDAENLIEALPLDVNGKLVLARARYREDVIVPVGKWGSEIKCKIRVYYRGSETAEGDERFARWEVQTMNQEGKWDIEILPNGKKNEGKFIPPSDAPEEIRAKFTEIPIVPCYTRKEGFFFGKPQFENLAELNSCHWRKNSNKDNVIDVASVPAKFFKGFTDEQINVVQWGPFRGINNSNEQSDIVDIAHSTGSVEVALKDLDRLELRMALSAKE